MRISLIVPVNLSKGVGLSFMTEHFDSSKTDELLAKCVQCGSCILICPMYRATEQEAFSPRGKLYFLKIKDAFPEQCDEELIKEYATTIFCCAFCGRCQEICSSEVDLTDIFREQRKNHLSLFPKLLQISILFLRCSL